MDLIIRLTLVLFIGLVFVGCDLLGSLTNESLSVDDGDSHQAVAHGIEVFLDTPEGVHQHHPFQIEYHLINHRSEDVTITTGHSCLAWIEVTDDGEPANIKGTRHGCYTALTDHHIAAGDTVTQVLSGRAEMTNSDGPADIGTYTVTAESDLYEIEGERAELPTVEGQFNIQE